MAIVTITTNEGVVVERFKADEYNLAMPIAVKAFRNFILGAIERAQIMDDLDKAMKSKENKDG